MSRIELWANEGMPARWLDPGRLGRALRPALPSLLFGLRLWLGVCLALYVAFWLELDNPTWAGTSAAIMAQPSLGASLRKGWYRIVGTFIGATVIVVLTAFTVQDRFGFLFSLALWCAICGMAATLLRNFASYAAALAGYTAVIIAVDELGTTGGASGDVLMFAIGRASEISIGIVSAGLVLTAADFGNARRRLAISVASLANEISTRLSRTLSQTHSELVRTREVRRGLLRRVIGLDPLIDETIGESTELRYHSPILHAIVSGLFSALAAWRGIAVHLESDGTERCEAEIIRNLLPEELRAPPSEGEAERWAADPERVIRVCDVSVRKLTDFPDRTPALRLLADRTAEAMRGIRQAANGLLLIKNPAAATKHARTPPFVVPDILPALVNAARALVAIGAVELFWILTAWPNGAPAMIFTAVVVLLFSPQSELAAGRAMGFLIGTVLAAVAAAIVAFAILPGVETFLGFSLAIALLLVPAGALMTQPWQTAVFTAMTVNFIPLLAPSNPMVFDLERFYNTSLALTVGIGTGLLALRLIPPLPPAFRARRLATLTLRDLRRIAARPMRVSAARWEARVFGRLAQFPKEADSLQGVRILAAFTVGTKIMALSKVAHRFAVASSLDAALVALARGDVVGATEQFARFDRDLAALPDTIPGERIRSRARGGILEVSEVLKEHFSYFGEGRGS